MDWLEAPNLYSWVELECDDPGTAPKALDDVVAQRSDGTRLYLQVKCANDADLETSALSWDWLLAQTGRGRSLLRKLYDAWANVPRGVQADIRLVTNRRPDRQFEACLDGRFVAWDHIFPALQARIREELSEAAGALDFFAQLRIKHSSCEFRTLDARLRQRFISRHGDPGDWYHFKVEALEWLVLRAPPGEPQRISLDELRRISSARRPQPMREDFTVPPDYQVPDEEFHAKLMANVVSGHARGFVLRGSPGRGKSTYLSYLCEQFDEQGIPYVRHHYSLPAEGREPRRLFGHEVASTLIHQLETWHGEQSHGAEASLENLRDWVDSCAGSYAQEGKRLVVILDGLDHVWRENREDIEPLQAVLKELLPVPDNVLLLLGTQPLSVEHTPAALLENQDALASLVMPSMTPSAIERWVQCQLAANRVPTTNHRSQDAEYVSAIALALHTVSGGHPLHLIYSFEALVTRGKPVTEYAIEHLPPCPDGDIRNYYAGLWRQLPHRGKDVLHLMCDFEFQWHPTGFQRILGDDEETHRALSNVRHLADVTAIGWRPFHNSLAAFVRDIDEHEQRLSVLLPRVSEWLRAEAPEYLRWAWLWLTEARDGDASALVEGPSWEWARDALVDGYPPRQMVLIMGEAERIAFANKQYARTVELRWLGVRLKNGPDFQTDSFYQLKALALKLNPESYVVDVLVDNLQDEDSATLANLAEFLVSQQRDGDALRCQHEVRSRFNRKLRLGGSHRDTLRGELEPLLNLFGTTAKFDRKRLVRLLNRWKHVRTQLFLALVLALVRRHHVSALMSLVPRPKTPEMQRLLEAETVRLACRLRVVLSDWPEFACFGFHSLSSCWSLLRGVPGATLREVSVPSDMLSVKYVSYEAEPQIQEWLHRYFFWCFATALISNAPHFPVLTFPKLQWLTAAIPALERAAVGAARRMRRGDVAGFGHIWRFLEPLPLPHEHDDRRDERCMKRALLHIATDLALLGSRNIDAGPVSLNELEKAGASRYFAEALWRTRLLGRGETVLSKIEAESYIAAGLAAVAGSVSVFNERVDAYFDLARLAALYDDERSLHGALVHIAQCLLGYGWRKDMGMFHALDAIEACAEVSEPRCEQWLRRLAPAVEQITEFTDGDETGGAREHLGELLIRVSPTLYVSYYESLMQRAEWRIAERVLDAYIERGKDGPEFAALTGTLFEEGLLQSLRKRSEGPIRAYAAKQCARLGKDEQQPEERESATYAGDEKRLALDPDQFPPDQFDALLEMLDAARHSTGAQAAVSGWFSHWAQRRPTELLEVLERYFEHDEVAYLFMDIPDAAFDLALRLVGRQGAYRWLVRAHIHQHGWDPYFYGKQHRIRIGKLLANYPERWGQFIHDTSKPSDRVYAHKGLVIGTGRLVEFLALAGQRELAARITETLVSLIEREVVEQPLPVPEWLVT